MRRRFAKIDPDPQVSAVAWRDGLGRLVVVPEDAAPSPWTVESGHRWTSACDRRIAVSAQPGP